MCFHKEAYRACGGPHGAANQDPFLFQPWGLLLCWGGTCGARLMVHRCIMWPLTVSDYRNTYKKNPQNEQVCHAYRWIKDQNTQVGDGVNLNTRSSKLVTANKHHNEEQWEDKVVAMGMEVHGDPKGAKQLLHCCCASSRPAQMAVPT